MFKQRHSHSARIIAVFLVLIFVIPIATVVASESEVTPRASYYLDSYNTYPYNAALGKIRIYFDVTGVDYMDEIGALNIKVYESTNNETWTLVKTFKHNTTSGMLGTNKIYYSNYVEYAGTIGRYYKAYVCIWAGKDGDGDTRYMWTQPKKATLFAG